MSYKKICKSRVNSFLRLQVVLSVFFLFSILVVFNCNDVPEPPPGPRGDVVLEEPPEVPGDPVGRINGSFSVTSEGVAQYVIPITVPPGRAGLQPDLKLVYNSNQRNGTLGVGWSLSGLSVIERCGHNIAYDSHIDVVKFDTSDNFCIDGTRLIHVHGNRGKEGAVYVTKKESFSKVVLHGDGPDYFEVHSKDGRVMLYGCDGNTLESGERGKCSALMFGRDDVPRAWALRQVRDRHLNYMRFEYQRWFSNADEDWDNDGVQNYTGLPETVQYAPNKIEYTGNGIGDSVSMPADKRVEFHYTQTPIIPSVQGHRDGIRGAINSYLQEITTWVKPNKQALSYTLQYKLSKTTKRRLVDNITLCDPQNTCLPPTHFEWQDNFSSLGQHWEASSELLPSSTVFQSISAITPTDVNGDGKQDLVYVRNGSWRLLVSTGSTSEPFDAEVQILSSFLPVEDRRADGRISWVDRVYPLDINNDGREDLILQQSDDDTLRIFLSTGHDSPYYEQQKQTLNDNWTNSEKRSRRLLFGDINGDALPDYLFCPIDDHEYKATWMYKFNAGDGTFGPLQDTNFNCYTPQLGHTHYPFLLDINGDGANELMFVFHKNLPAINVWNALDFTTAVPKVRHNLLPAHIFARTADVNGDGLRDILQHVEGIPLPHLRDETQNQIQVWLNTGNGFIGGQDGLRAGHVPLHYEWWKEYGWPLTGSYLQDSWGPEFLPWHSVGDFSKDGRDDLLIVEDRNSLIPLGYEHVEEDCEGLETNLLTMIGSSALRDFVTEANGDLSLVPSGYIARLPICSRSGIWLYDYEVIADIDGDAQPDIVKIAGDRLMIQFDGRPQRDLLKFVRDGLIGVQPPFDDNRFSHKIEYSNSTDPEVYTQEFFEGVATACNHPTACGRPKGELVSSVSSYNGENAPPTLTRYSYHDSRYNRHGLGWLGFGQVVARNEHNGKTIITTRNNHYLDATTKMYPYLGMVTESKSFVFDDVNNKYLVNIVTNTLGIKNLGLWNNGLTYLPYNEESNSRKYSALSSNPYESEKISEKWVAVNLDTYGNIVWSRAWDSEGNQKIIDFVYDYDIQHWFIGLLTSAVETSFTLTDSASRVREYTYDSNTGSLLTKKRIYENGNFIRQTYTRDTFGNAVKLVTDTESGEVRTYDYEYDSGETYVFRITNGKNHSIYYAFDEKTGQNSVYMDPNGVEYKRAFDTFGRLRRVIPPIGTETIYNYDTKQLNNISFLAHSKSFGSELVSKSILDSAGRVQRTEKRALNNIMNVTQIEYNKLGKVSRRSLPYKDLIGVASGSISYRYDNVGRLIRQTNPDLTSVRVAYGDNTVEESYQFWKDGIFILARQKTLELNAAGNITTVTDADGNASSVSYGPFGFVKEVVDAAGNPTTFSRNAYGFLEHGDDLNAGKQSSTYNSYGELLEVIDGNGDITNFHRDELGRVLERTNIDGKTQYNYDLAQNGIGKIDYVVDTNQNIKSYSYDNYGRNFKTITEMASGQQYEFTTYYNAAGFPEIVKYPSSPGNNPFEIRYEYDNAGIPFKIINNKTQGLVYEVHSSNEFNQITGEEFGSNSSTVRSYNELNGRTESIVTWSPAHGTIQHLAYTYDAYGNLKTRANKDLGTMLIKDQETFWYDKLHRLTDNQYCWYSGEIDPEGCNPTKNITYDVVGNILSKTDLGQYTYSNSKPHAVKFVAGIGSYYYDDAGNQTERPGETVEYNSVGLIASVTAKADGSKSKFQYDHAFKRITKLNPDGSERRYINGIFEHSISGSTQEYTYYIKLGNRIISYERRQWSAVAGYTDISTKYLHQDNLGSVESITDDSGAVLQKLSFDPHGVPRAANWDGPQDVVENPLVGLRFGFTGHEHDEYSSGSSIVNAGGRFYDQKIGRFLSPDPFSSMLNTQGMNRYAYVNNRPMNLVDPSGLFPSISTTHTFDNGPDPGMLSDAFAAMGRAFSAIAPALSKLIGKHVIVDFQRTRNVHVNYNKPTVSLGTMATRASAWQVNSTGGMSIGSIGAGVATPKRAFELQREVRLVFTPRYNHTFLPDYARDQAEVELQALAGGKANWFDYEAIIYYGANDLKRKMAWVIDPNDIVVWAELASHAGASTVHSHMRLLSKDTKTLERARARGDFETAKDFMLYSDSSGEMWNLDIFEGIPFKKYDCDIVLSGCAYAASSWGRTYMTEMADKYKCRVTAFDGNTEPADTPFSRYLVKPLIWTDTEALTIHPK